jgi:hypothetical protein
VKRKVKCVLGEVSIRIYLSESRTSNPLIHPKLQLGVTVVSKLMNRFNGFQS